MTDNEIIKALECCSNASCTSCHDCPYREKQFQNHCGFTLSGDALDLINRQKAEIERLKHNIELLAICKKDLPEQTAKAIKAEAVKELLDKLIKEYGHHTLNEEISIDAIFCSIKHIVKEMVGEAE